jgi:hypothetical protein
VREDASHAACVILSCVPGEGLLLIAFARRVRLQVWQKMKDK